MAFQQGLSGLSIASKALDAISNNVSNANTVGYKQASAQFSDVFASSLAGSRTQVGIGATVAQMAQQFNQGNVTTTSNALDLAINGEGFFRMSDPGGTITYSRNGQFQTDKEGYIVNAQGLRLTGKIADANGAYTGATGAIKLNLSDAKPQATSKSGYNVNLDSRSATPTGLTAGSGKSAAIASLTGATPSFTLAATDKLKFQLDGETGTTELALPAGTYNDVGSLAAAIQSAIDQSSLKGRIKVAGDSTPALIFSSARTGRLSEIAVTAATSPGATTPAALLPTGTPVLGSNDAFNINDPSTYTSSTSQTVYDSLGNPHVQTLYFVKTALANTWDVYSSLDGLPPQINEDAKALDPATTENRWMSITFDTNGVFQGSALYQELPSAPGTMGYVPSPSTKVNVAYDITTGATTQLQFEVDLLGTTQFGNSYGINQLSQDGFTTGKLSGLSVSADGTVEGNFSNGQSRTMGQVYLVGFENPNGLRSLGANQWASTSDSGPEKPNAPGTGVLGVIQSAAVEESNVDLTAELVNMITQQRSYQANAQSIKTQDQILQTLVNLR
ncbi:flagellar hook protein FlgE [Zoogloea sp.]|uniref:flagellar hook-basal body complex protein n=1 Tax=Zoogloea sp. TaxID=49181 RepID=UPI00260DB23F|nr:flagellar hook protein FlgE [Zoogloea sp.]MDD3352781.1 flagellar hook protein FlgE [Zoogloea sp.]